MLGSWYRASRFRGADLPEVLGADPGDLFPEHRGGLSAQVKAVEVKPFVGRVGEAIRQDEADQQARGLEQPSHHLDGADRSARSDQGRRLAVDALEGPAACLDQRMVDRPE